MTSMTPLQMTLICVRYQAQVSLLPRNTLRTLPFSRRRRRTTFLACVFGRVKLPVACQPPSQVDRNCMWHLLVIDRPHLLNLISLIHIPHLIARQKSETGAGLLSSGFCLFVIGSMFSNIQRLFLMDYRPL
jgi:hypothetical protein